MEKNKVKMKYHMGIWKELPDYPCEEDVIFELNTYLIKDGRPDGEFSEHTFNSFLSNDWKNTKHGEIVKALIESNYFVKQKGKPGGIIKYKIKDNPHY